MHQTGTFTAYDRDGRPYTIGVFQESAAGVTAAGGHVSPDEKRMTTADGLHVNWRGKGRYEVVGGDENITVTCDDPEAP